MLQQSIALVQNGRRHLINIEVDRALLYEILKEYKYSEEVYRKKIEELEEGIDLLRKEVADAKLDVERLESAAKDRAEVAAANVVTGSSSTSADTTDATTDQSRNEKEQIALDRAKDLLRTRNSRLTSWTKLYHRVLFCLACLQSELKDEAGSEATFKRAEAVRKELMVPAEEQVSEGLANMKEVLAKANIDKFVQGAEQGTNEYWRVSLDRRITGGIMSAHVISDANRCAAFLNEQVGQCDCLFA